MVIAQSPQKVRPVLVRFLDEAESRLTAFARDTFSELYEQLKDLESRIERVTHGWIACTGHIRSAGSWPLCRGLVR